jgi:tRNA A-37 threonylcarbamoyl transferase component Bud32
MGVGERAELSAWVDQVADRFDAAWRSGSPPRIADFLGEVSGPRRTALLIELVKIDLECRWKAGDRRALADYLADFPDLRAADESPPPDLVAYMHKVRAAWGDRATEVERPGPLPPAFRPPPALIGKYPVLSPLDEGGQALVYLGLHPTLRKQVVIKLSRVPAGADPAAHDALAAEGKLLAALDHPNLARVYDLDSHEGHPFLVLEYVPGRNLQQHAEQQALTPRQAASLTAKLARTLAAAHRGGVLHLDLKPRNVLIDERGEPRLIDFGMARLRDAWSADADQPWGGTPAFMAPEQARGERERLSERSDLFGLGAVLYYLLTGKPPFAGLNVYESLTKARRGDLDASALRVAGVPRGLEKVCLRALAVDPAGRYARAEDLAADLERFLKRRRVLVLLAVGAALVLLAAIGWWFLQRPGTDFGRDAGGEIRVQVYRQEEVFDLKSALPLRTGRDRVRIECRIPAGYHGALFLVNSGGGFRALQPEVSPGNSFDKLHFPPKGEYSLLKGPPGVEFLLVCAGPRPIGPEEVRRLLDLREPLPALPPRVLVRLNREEVKVEGARDLGAAAGNAVSQVQHRLDQVRRRLAGKVEFVQGVAFSHRPL